jgi:hypothetical protein
VTFRGHVIDAIVLPGLALVRRVLVMLGCGVLGNTTGLMQSNHLPLLILQQ